MKTHEEIKKGLECCTEENSRCLECPYPIGYKCAAELMKDALAYIQQLGSTYSQVKSRLAQVERERDAAINELPHHCWNCKYHRDTPIEEIDTGGLTIHRYCDADYCYPDEENSSWQWRGPCPENTKEGTK